jgi:hypothetical protein
LTKDRLLVGLGATLLAGSLVFGPVVADDLRHLAEIAGLSYPFSAGLVLIGAGRWPESGIRRSLFRALGLLAMGAALGIAIDRVTIVAICTLIALGVLLWSSSRHVREYT